MITKKQFSKLISQMNIGDKIFLTKSDGTELSIKKINALQYQIHTNSVDYTLTNPKYELLVE